MINGSVLNTESKTLTLNIGKAQVILSLDKVLAEYTSKDVKMTFDIPGEYEVQDLLITLAPLEDNFCLYCLGNEKSTLVVPTLPNYTKAISEENLEHLGAVDILILQGDTTSDDVKKLIQLIEPRCVVRIGGKLIPGEVQIGELTEKNLSFPEESTAQLWLPA